MLFCSRNGDVLYFSVPPGNFSQTEDGSVEGIMPSAWGRCVGECDSSVCDGFSNAFSLNWDGGAP